MKKQLSMLILVMSASLCEAETFPLVAAEKVGMSTERLAGISQLGQRYVDEKKLAGIVTLVARDGKIVHFEAQGSRSINDARPLQKDAIFRINSMTKPITAVGLMRLYEQGLFQLSDPISKYIPELKNLEVLTEDGELVPAEHEITIHELMTHTSGFSYDFDDKDPVDRLYQKAQIFKSDSIQEFVEKLAKLPLRHQPGTKFHYSVSIEVMGLLIERISGEELDVYLQKHIFQPLAMNDTFFTVPDNKLARLVPNHKWIKDDNAMEILNKSPYYEHLRKGPKLFSGGGGLMSTASDYLRFTEMLRRGGTFNGARILGPKTIRFMTKDHLPGMNIPRPYGAKGFGFGIGGFHIEVDNTASGLLNSEGTYSWSGGSGTVFWIDPVEDIVVIAMIQLKHSPWPLGSELRILTNQAVVEMK